MNKSNLHPLLLEGALYQPLGPMPCDSISSKPTGAVAHHYATAPVGEKRRLNYIMGNPPFVGYSLQTKEQKEDILSIYA